MKKEMKNSRKLPLFLLAALALALSGSQDSFAAGKKKKKSQKTARAECLKEDANLSGAALKSCIKQKRRKS